MHDVVIIGAGVIGSSIARELSRYKLDIIVLEKGSDVASGASKANSGIVHAGYDAKPGTLKAKYNVQGQRMFGNLARELDFPFRRCGSLVVSFVEEGIDRLHELKEQGEKNGVRDLSVTTGRTQLKALEPNINENVTGALVVPEGGIVCPYEMTIAYAENAAVNGVKFRFEQEVTGLKKTGDHFELAIAGGETVESRYVINCAGLYADKINNMVSEDKIEIIPRRGEYCLLDKTEGALAFHTIFQLPTKMGKGILVTPTVDGNILLGPTSVDMEDKEDTSTTREGLASVLEIGSLSVTKVPAGKIITSFTGLRPHATKNDFIIGEAADVPGFINVSGIESPGLTSAPAIAKEVERIMVDLAKPQVKDNFVAERKAAPRFRHLSNDERKALIKKDPNYGKVICRCETVTKGEILEAIRSPLGVCSLDAIKRRTRAGMGRCQAGFCSMRLLDIVAEEMGVSIADVVKNGSGTNLLYAKNKSIL